MSSSTQTETPTATSRPEQARPGEADPGPFLVQGPQDGDAARESTVDVTLTGRNVEVPEHFRAYVAEKLGRLERYDTTLQRFDVELNHEPNRRRAKSCQRVEMTATGRGPVVRAEACADSFYAALESAADKLEARLRRACDQRKVHHGRRNPVSVAEALAAKEEVTEEQADAEVAAPDATTGDTAAALAPPEPLYGSGDDEGPGRIVRVKEHPGTPMSVDAALYEMELVGHDFFLFQDAASGRPSVVYRRQAFDYGVISLS